MRGTLEFSLDCAEESCERTYDIEALNRLHAIRVAELRDEWQWIASIGLFCPEHHIDVPEN